MISAIALDLGTTSIKAGLLDQNGVLGRIIIRSAPPISAGGGRYESDAREYAAIADQVLGECMSEGSVSVPGGSKPLGLCCQRSSFLLWERAGGEPVTPLISWQDNRGAASCEALRAHEDAIRDLTGLPLTQYYFAPKLRVVLQENPEWLARLKRGELLAGTLDSFMIWRWTGGRHYLTDASMAARTMLMDIRKRQWSPRLCEYFGIPLEMLPGIRPSAGLDLRLDNGMVLQSGVGDQSAALFSSISEDRAEALVNLGTGCFVVRNLPGGEVPGERSALKGYLLTLVYQDSKRQACFAAEGTLNSIAAALAPYPVEACQTGDPAVDDIYCIAEPSGLGAPYFRNDLGIRFSRSVEHLTPHQVAGLLLEAVVFRVTRILEDFQHMAPLERVYLSGGLSALTGIQQGIAHCVPFAVYRLEQSEASLQGAALLAAGMPAACSRKSVRIEATGNADALREKYRRWKSWLDDLLAS